MGWCGLKGLLAPSFAGDLTLGHNGKRLVQIIFNAAREFLALVGKEVIGPFQDITLYTDPFLRR